MFYVVIQQEETVLSLQAHNDQQSEENFETDNRSECYNCNMFSERALQKRFVGPFFETPDLVHFQLRVT